MADEKYPVNHHVSLALIMGENGNELFGNIYDPSHFNGGKFNLMGGNMSRQDKGPWELLQRELIEEIQYSEEERRRFNENLVKWGSQWRINELASTQDIEFVRTAILETLTPYRDYLCHVPGFAGEKGKADVVFSVWASKLSKPVLECIKNNQKAGRSLVVEGFTKIMTLDDLLKGQPICAAGTGPIVTDYFNLRDRAIPNPCMITTAPIGMPRGSFEDYKEFDYRCLIDGREEG